MTHQWIECGDGRSVYREVKTSQAKRSTLACPMVIGDTMPAAQHPVDSRYYESKSTFSRITREAGCIEMGNDPARLRPQPKSKPDRQAIRTSLEKAAARVARGERAKAD